MFKDLNLRHIIPSIVSLKQFNFKLINFSVIVIQSNFNLCYINSPLQ